MFTINDYLDDILEEFEDYVHSGIRLCDLKSVHFDAGKIPDYSNIHVQQLYLLRYAYAYSFEYKCMYRTLLDRTNFRKNISVTSIGCGSMLDYWALANVVPRSCDIRYRGIDTIDWAYQMEARIQDDVRFICNDAIDCQCFGFAVNGTEICPPNPAHQPGPNLRIDYAVKVQAVFCCVVKRGSHPHLARFQAGHII